tara:strand:- start:1781 stop:2284 length:504 start_codon:yes stop_codon:yes gene_type:complete
MEILARFCVAYCLIMIFLLLDLVSFNVPFFHEIRPSLTLMLLFYWGIYRPSMTPTWLAFVLGLFIDLVSGVPLGLNALLFVAVAYVIQSQRKIFMGQPFLSVYFGFALVSFGVKTLQWMIFCLVGMKWVAIDTVMGAVLLGVAFFPVAFLLMNVTHKILPHDVSVMK